MTPRQFVLARHPEALCFMEYGATCEIWAVLFLHPRDQNPFLCAKNTPQAWRKAAKKIKEAEAKGVA